MEVERGAEYFDYLAGLSQFASASHFVDVEYAIARTKLLGKSKKGQQPLLGRFKGECKGARAPARIQRSDSRGKRRNNETDETCRLRRGEGCEVCSDANSPFAVFFLPPAAFSLPCKEKGAESSPRLRRGRADSVVRPYESVQTGRCAPRTPCADKLSPFR